jgi:hypothetical protein
MVVGVESAPGRHCPAKWGGTTEGVPFRPHVGREGFFVGSAGLRTHRKCVLPS